MAFCCKIDNIVKVVLLEKLCHKFLITNIALNKHMARITLDVFQVFKISRICKLVQIYEQDVIVLFKHIVDEVGADESGTACY